jgi:hypothetical protein
MAYKYVPLYVFCVIVGFMAAAFEQPVAVTVDGFTPVDRRQMI